jgi:hypothetical protein
MKVAVREKSKSQPLKTMRQGDISRKGLQLAVNEKYHVK